jgi:hypothetical protein
MNGFAMKNPKATQTKQTAAACYAERHGECQDLLSASPSAWTSTADVKRRIPPTGDTPAISAA